MHSDDNDSDKPVSGSPLEGLGHDPLEWLQEEDDEQATESVGDAPPTEVHESSSENPEPQRQASAEVPDDTPGSRGAETPKMVDDGGKQSLSIDNHKAIIRLPEKLSVQIVEPLHTEWKTLFYDLPQSLEIDATEVKDADAAGIQLLYVLVKQMSIKGCDVVVLNVHHDLNRYIKVTGLEEFFIPFVHAA